MTRSLLLGAASAAALSCISAAASAQAPTTVRGSGATLPSLDYNDEINTYNPAANGFRPASAAQFSSYLLGVGSGGGIRGFVLNDYTCFTQAAAGTSSCLSTNTGGGANTVHYGATDAKLQNGATAFSSWATGQYGQSVSGNLIQIPALGTGVALGIGYTSQTTPSQRRPLAGSGAVRLKDHDVCEIYSGGYTDWAQVTDITDVSGVANYTQPLKGAIRAAYRTDGSGTTFLFTNHLASVCTPGADTPAGFTFRATQTFSTLFPNIAAVPTLIGAAGNGGIRSALVGDGATPPTANIGFISPDFTTAAQGSSITGAVPTVAGLFQQALVGTAANPYVRPILSQIQLALRNPKSGVPGTENLTPPSTKAAALNPANWVPLLPQTNAGYPIVGYTNFLFATCYRDQAISKSVVHFLVRHYTSPAFRTIQMANGFVPLGNTPAAAFQTYIVRKYLGNGTVGTGDTVWNINIGNRTLCNDGRAPAVAGTALGR